MDLPTIWFILIAVLWIGYFVLEGFDFGVGILLPFIGRNEPERRAMLRTIGQGARLQMEKLLAGPVYLELFVKVVPGWRGSAARLAELGYTGD